MEGFSRPLSPLWLLSWMILTFRRPLGAPRSLVRGSGAPRRQSLLTLSGSRREAARPCSLNEGLSLSQRLLDVQQPRAQHFCSLSAAPALTAAAAAHQGDNAAASSATAAPEAALKQSCDGSVVDVALCLAPLLAPAAPAGGDLTEARVAAVREVVAAFSAAAEATEAAGTPIYYRYPSTGVSAYRGCLLPAAPATPTAVAAAVAAAASKQPLQQQQAWVHLGSPIFVLLLQALRAAAVAAEKGRPGSDSSSSNSSSNNDCSGSVEAPAAEVAALWQLQVNKDLRRLRLASEAVQDVAASASEGHCSPAAAEAGPTNYELHPRDIAAGAAALLCTAAEAASLLAEMQLRHSVRDMVPTLLLILERLRLSRQLCQQALHQQQQQQQQLAGHLQGDAAARVEDAPPAAPAEAAASAAAAVQCLHALGRCQLFSEQLLKTVSAEHVPYLDADFLALYIFECGRMGLRCKRWIDARIERATSAVDQMSPASLLLACAGLYRFCTEWRAFYAKATPRLVAILGDMDFYQLRLMLRIGKHLNPAFEEADLNLLVRNAARLLNSRVTSLAPQQLCCIASFIERRCADTPAEFLTLTRSLAAALEATEPAAATVEDKASSAPSSDIAGAASPAAASDPLALVHPLHDLVDVVDCLASHGMQSPLVPRIEAILASRFTEIEYSVNFTLWLVCLDAFSRVRGFYPRLLLQRIVASICNIDVSNSKSTNIGSPGLLDSLSVVQRLNVENETNLFRSLRDALTCVFPLSLAVYIHPVVFDNALRFVESRCSKHNRRGRGLYASDRHLEFLFLSHLCWSFLVAEMHGHPHFASLLARTFASAPRLGQNVDCPQSEEGTAVAGDGNGVSPFTLPWRERDVALPEEVRVEAGTAMGGGEWGSPPSLTPLDCISYRNYCEPSSLLQQVARVLQLETPHLAQATGKHNAFKVYSSALVRWKAERREDIYHFLREVRAVGTAGELSFREANEGTPQPSSSPQYGHLWPFSEVSLWYGKIPIVLMAEDEGLVMAAEADGRRKNYNTGHKYLLLRAFRAQGFLKVVFLTVEEWQEAHADKEKVALLRRKLEA